MLAVSSHVRGQARTEGTGDEGPDALHSGLAAGRHSHRDGAVAVDCCAGVNAGGIGTTEQALNGDRSGKRRTSGPTGTSPFTPQSSVQASVPGSSPSI
jgi:hypothetical protein